MNPQQHAIVNELSFQVDLLHLLDGAEMKSPDAGRGTSAAEDLAAEIVHLAGPAH